MTTVDPYIVRYPERITAQDGRPTDEWRAWLDYDNRWKHDMWRLVTGGTGGDATGGIKEADANENRINVLQGLLVQALRRISDLEGDITPFIPAKGFRAVTITSDYTATDHDFVNASQGATITMPSNPICDIVIVRNNDGSIINLSGNGRNINGNSTGVMHHEGVTLQIQYFVDSDEWLIR